MKTLTKKLKVHRLGNSNYILLSKDIAGNDTKNKPGALLKYTREREQDGIKLTIFIPYVEI